MTLQEWLLEAERRLAVAGVDGARFEAQLLAAHGLGKSRSWVIAHPEAPIDAAALEAGLRRRECREPLAYLTGLREFYGRAFQVAPAVLIPRQETEVLVEACLRLAPTGTCRVLDVGTGSGCIAISLQLERPAWEVWATDLSQDALAMAQKNADNLGASEVRFLQSNLFEGLEGMGFDLIVSNPPYIADGEALMPEVGQHEPPEALFAGPTGLEIYGRLARESRPHLSPNGRLLVEIGAGQEGAVLRLFAEAGWILVEATHDLSGVVRVLAFGPKC